MKNNALINTAPWVAVFALITCALFPTTPAFAITSPEIGLYAESKSIRITNGDTTPSTGDNTDFGDVGADTTANFYYEICNDIQPGNNLNLTGSPLVELTGDAGFSVTIQPASVIGPAHCTNFQITFAPGSLGTKTATVSIASNDADENPYTFAIAGNGIPPAPEIRIEYEKSLIENGDTTPSVDEGTDRGDLGVGATTSLYYFICNDGSTNVNLSGSPLVEITGDADFSIIENLPSVISASNCEHFIIAFTPTSLGAKSATVSIVNNDADENPYTFALAGNGVPPIPDITVLTKGSIIIENGDTTPSVDDKTDFGDLGTGTTSEIIYQICNSGSGNLNLGGTPLVEVIGDGDFSVIENPPSVIGVSDCEYFIMAFTPTSLGEKTATIHIASDDADENPYTFVIAGNGVPPVPEMDVREAWSGISIEDGDTTPQGMDGTDFAEVEIGSNDGVVDYFVCNNGNANLHLTGDPLVELTGDADFSVTNIPDNTIGVSNCSVFEISFYPTSTGLKSAVVSIANDDPDENPYNFTIQGTGIGPDSYETDNNFSSSKPISPGETQTHSILPVGEWDYIRFTLDQESSVVITTSGPDDKADTYLDLYDSNKTLIASDDDSGSSLYSRIALTCGANPLQAGTYYIRATEYGNDKRISDYKISFVKTVCNKTISFKSLGSQDGWLLESSENSSLGGSLNNSATTFQLGDDANKKQYRGILSFQTQAIPDQAVITKAILKIKKSAVTGGGDPLSIFQGFVVDIKTGFFGANALQITDFQAIASKIYGPFSPALNNGWYHINLTSAKAYINKQSANSGLTQFRLRFKLDDNNNTIANVLSLFSGNATNAADRPQLVITYYMP